MEFDVGGFLLLFGVSLEIFGIWGLECAGRCGSYLPLGVPIGFASQFFLVDGNGVQDENYPGCFSNLPGERMITRAAPKCSDAVFGRIRLPFCRHLDG